MIPHEYLAARERQLDLLREAQLRRLVAQLPTSPRGAFYAPALERLGRWLIAWGWRLRARYGEVEMYGVQHEKRFR
jgi:hypothetical protein